MDNFEKQILIGANANTKLDISAVKSLFDNPSLDVNKSVSHELTTSSINWDDKYGVEKWTETYNQELSVVGSSAGLSDTIKFTTTKIAETSHIYDPEADNLSLINQYTGTGSDDRQFNFDDAQNVYVVKEDIGTTSAGKLAINGKSNGDNRSVIDFTKKIDEDTNIKHKGFEIQNNNTEIVLKDVEVKGATALATGNASTNVKISLDNANIHDNGSGISTFGDVEIKGSSTISDDIKVMGTNSKIDIDGSQDVTIDSKLSGTSTSKLNFHDGKVNLEDDAEIISFETMLDDVVLDVSNSASLSSSTITFNSSNTLRIKNENSLNSANNIFNDTTTINIANDSIRVLNLGNVELNGTLKMQVDADLENSQMDRISANSANIGSEGKIKVERINLLSPTSEKQLDLMFTDNLALANTINYTGNGTIAYSPIYKYNTSYIKKDDGGYFRFALSQEGYNNFNPSVVSSLVASKAGVQTAVNNSFHYAFQNADSFTKFPARIRSISINANYYAINDEEPFKESNGVSTEYNQNMDFAGQYQGNSSIWFKPYSVFENMHLKNGQKVNSISYGSLVGFDSDFIKLKGGWHSVVSGYLGYNGAQLSYQGIDISMNGGLLGITGTLYKNNFWTTLTASTGAFVSETHGMYGNEYPASIMAGVASKTGYNFEFKEGRFIIQPMLFMSYSMINTFDYTNAAGVRIDSKPINTLQLNPMIRFVGNIKGWQPYVSAGMVWSLLDKTVAKADNVRLPEMQVKPYVEYGVGVQKSVGENFTAFGQAMMHNGGRNGVSLTGGFRWAIGRTKPEKEVNKTDKKNDIKTYEVNEHEVFAKSSIANKTVIKKLCVK